MPTTRNREGDSPPIIRCAGPADAERVRVLTRAAYAKWVPVLGREPKPMGADYDRAVREHRIDLLEAEGEVVALVELVTEPGQLLVENVAVAPGHQGRGFGRHLLRHAEAVAAAIGVRRVRLYTNQLMAANVALYQALGYAIDHEEANAFGTVIHLSKLLP